MQQRRHHMTACDIKLSSYYLMTKKTNSSCLITVSTYRIIEIFADFKLSLTTGSSFVKTAEQLQCVAEVASSFCFSCFVSNHPLYSKQTNKSLRLSCFLFQKCGNSTAIHSSSSSSGSSILLKQNPQFTITLHHCRL